MYQFPSCSRCQSVLVLALYGYYKSEQTNTIQCIIQKPTVSTCTCVVHIIRCEQQRASQLHLDLPYETYSDHLTISPLLRFQSPINVQTFFYNSLVIPRFLFFLINLPQHLCCTFSCSLLHSCKLNQQASTLFLHCHHFPTHTHTHTHTPPPNKKLARSSLSQVPFFPVNSSVGLLSSKIISVFLIYSSMTQIQA